MPAAVVATQRVARLVLMDAAWGIPVGFVLGVLATGMARRAKRNLRSLRLDGSGTGVATTGIILGVLGLALALTCALSVGVYEGVLYYQHHYR
jgi:F420-0:gamma-glutamyl ligase-like protein